MLLLDCKSISQLTAYERRRLNLNRFCCICNSVIHDYDPICMEKRRDRREVEYTFAHWECYKELGNPSLFKHKGD